MGSGTALFHEALGFDPPVQGRVPVEPQTPSGLSATGSSKGVTELSFNGNNAPGRVTYLISARTGDSDAFFIIGSSRRQRFKHTGAKPGVPVLYRVHAQASRGRLSDWSNEATIYKE